MGRDWSLEITRKRKIGYGEARLGCSTSALFSETKQSNRQTSSAVLLLHWKTRRRWFAGTVEESRWEGISTRIWKWPREKTTKLSFLCHLIYKTYQHQPAGPHYDNCYSFYLPIGQGRQWNESACNTRKKIINPLTGKEPSPIIWLLSGVVKLSSLFSWRTATVTASLKTFSCQSESCLFCQND